jgi:hypothetical protein
MKNRREFLEAAGYSLILGSAMKVPEITPIASFDASDGSSFTWWYDVDRSMANWKNAYWNVVAASSRSTRDHRFRFLSRDADKMYVSDEWTIQLFSIFGGNQDD